MAQFLLNIAKVESRGLKRFVLTKYSSLLLEPLKCFTFIRPLTPTLSTSGEGESETRVEDGFKKED
jgi:hypothetical protein